MVKKRVLGKGLSALISGADFQTAESRVIDDSLVVQVKVDEIGFNPNQPRKLFNANKLDELADSIKQVGVLQPVLIRKLGTGETAIPHPDRNEFSGSLKFCVVAGERRVRAARLAGLNEIPGLVCSYQEAESLKIALLENIQREDLGPVEEAAAYRDLMDSYGATQEELAEMLGKKRSSVANQLRILTLEREILEMLQTGKISRGHAKALLSMPSGPGRMQLAKMCHSRGLSVRDCENRIQAGGGKPSPRKKKRNKSADQPDPSVRALTERSERVFGSPVSINRNASTGKGDVSIRFYSDDDLIRILKIMGVDTDLG
ncbi:MAG: ParB/RepB/Spo0J family partition protein [Gemmatimonadales bacterium]|nr:ParB/RepB/Spo0J family partition protein [Gemmatimonadales bacterium]